MFRELKVSAMFGGHQKQGTDSALGMGTFELGFYFERWESHEKFGAEGVDLVLSLIGYLWGCTVKKRLWGYSGKRTVDDA